MIKDYPMQQSNDPSNQKPEKHSKFAKRIISSLASFSTTLKSISEGTLNVPTGTSNAELIQLLNSKIGIEAIYFESKKTNGKIDQYQIVFEVRSFLQAQNLAELPELYTQISLVTADGTTIRPRSKTL